MKAKVFPVVMVALGAVTPLLEEWLQQIPGKKNRTVSPEEHSAGNSQILPRTLKLPGRPEVEEDKHTTHCGEKECLY